MSQLLLTAGPHQGVKNTTEPFDDAADFAVNASNCYIRDPANKSGFLARPGFTLQNGSAELGAGNYGQGLHAHTALDGTVYRFYAAGGKLYRADSTNVTFTDVTPVGVTIAAYSTANLARVSFLSVGDSLVVTDGIHRPWLATNLASTPITGTYIDYDGAGGSWTAFGPPTIYQDCVVFIAATLPGGVNASPRIAIVFSEPNQAGTGYEQSGFQNFFNVIETGSDQLYAIWGTNIGIFYWREQSCGVLAGNMPALSTTVTRDSRSTSVGSVCPWSVAQFEQNIFFADMLGRPYLMPLYGAPQPIWQQFPAVTQAAPVKYVFELTLFATGVIVPDLSCYVATLWPTDAGASTPPEIMYAFDGRTGAYLGSWTINPAFQITAMGLTKNDKNANVFGVMGGKTAGTFGGYVWLLAALNPGEFRDNGQVPSISVTTARMGYTADMVINGDMATILAMSSAPVTVTITTPYTSSTTEATALAPNATQDGVYRIPVGLDFCAARGVQMTVSPTTADTQWGLQQVTMRVSASKAGPEDQ